MIAIPYGHHWLDEEDIQAVVEILRGDLITQGSKSEEFEEEFSRTIGSRYAVAVSSGTAALHSAMFALGIKPGDEVIVPAITFVATANCILYQGGIPVFADVDPKTLLIDREDIERKITPKTRAVISMDYAGQPCDYIELVRLCIRHRIRLVSDACHSLGAVYEGLPVGSLADMSTFSLHPVKAITSGEGGMVTTSSSEYASKIRYFRNHGIESTPAERSLRNSPDYEMRALGYNYRITDFQCALGLSQLRRLHQYVLRRQMIAKYYNSEFLDNSNFVPLSLLPGRTHAYHLYVVILREGLDRLDLFRALIANHDIGSNVHYKLVYLHPYYRDLGYKPGLCPQAESIAERIWTLPLYPRMTDEDVERVVTAVNEVTR